MLRLFCCTVRSCKYIILGDVGVDSRFKYCEELEIKDVFSECLGETRGSRQPLFLTELANNTLQNKLYSTNFPSFTGMQHKMSERIIDKSFSLKASSEVLF